jgi:hypothetical protein
MPESKKKKSAKEERVEVTLRLTPSDFEIFREDAFHSRIGNQGILYEGWKLWRRVTGRELPSVKLPKEYKDLGDNEKEFAEMAVQLHRIPSEKLFDENDPQFFVERQIFEMLRYLVQKKRKNTPQE